jgi:hypothetical protein
VWNKDIISQDFEEETIPYPLSEELLVSFQEMKSSGVRQYYTRDLKRGNFLRVGEVVVHEDSLLTDLHHQAFEELKIYELSLDGQPQPQPFQCKLSPLLSSVPFPSLPSFLLASSAIPSLLRCFPHTPWLRCCAVVPASPDLMILRQYRSDQLPGLLYSIFPPRQTAPVVATDLSSIGQKNNKNKKVSAAERIAVKTVKRAGISEGKEVGEVDLVIEVLEISQEVIGSPATGECVLWSLTPSVKTIYSPAPSPDVPSTSATTSVATEILHSEEIEEHIQVTACPPLFLLCSALLLSFPHSLSPSPQTTTQFSWPPVQSFFKGNGAMPNFNHLKNHFSAVHNIPSEDLLIFKYALSSSRFHQLTIGMKSQAHKGKGKKKSAAQNNSKTAENILLPPYSLRDGDLFAVIDLRSAEVLSTLPMAVTSEGQGQGQGEQGADGDKKSQPTLQHDLYVDRYEDVYLRWLKNEESPGGSDKKMKAKNMQGGKKKQIVEISLKFGGDLDFSSDEDGDEEAVEGEGEEG